MAKFGWSGPPKGSTANSPHPTLWEAQEAPATDAGTLVSAMSSKHDRAQLRRTHRSWGCPIEASWRKRHMRSISSGFRGCDFCLLITSSRLQHWSVARVFQAPASSVRPEGHLRVRGLRGKKKKKNTDRKEGKDQGRPNPTSFQAPTSNRGTRPADPLELS